MTTVLRARRGQAARARNLLCGWAEGPLVGRRPGSSRRGHRRTVSLREMLTSLQDTLHGRPRERPGPQSPCPHGVSPSRSAPTWTPAWGAQAGGCRRRVKLPCSALCACPLSPGAWREPGGSLGHGDKAAAPPRLPALPLLTPGVHGGSICPSRAQGFQKASFQPAHPFSPEEGSVQVYMCVCTRVRACKYVCA